MAHSSDSVRREVNEAPRSPDVLDFDRPGFGGSGRRRVKELN